MIKKKFLVFLLLFLVLSIPYCKKKLPTQAEIPVVTAGFITVTSNSDMLFIGSSETFTATITMSDGTTKAVVGGAWTTDDPSVATVGSTSGQVAILGSGTVNVFCQSEGKQGSKAIRGLPDYQGTWTGTYTIASCDATGDFLTEGFCNSFAVGMVLPMDLVLTQNQDQVTGRFYLGVLSADAVGPIQIDGRLILAGLAKQDPFSIDVVMQLQSMTPGQIVGEMAQLHLITGYDGTGQLFCNISDLGRTSSMAMALTRDAPRNLRPTFQSLLGALLRR